MNGHGRPPPTNARPGHYCPGDSAGCAAAASLERSVSPPLVLIILGPTASGKSALALTLAEKLNGEIVSCDSVAVYREFDIGAAKPPAEDRRRVSHRLIDVASPASRFTAADYSSLPPLTLLDITS